MQHPTIADENMEKKDMKEKVVNLDFDFYKAAGTVTLAAIIGTTILVLYFNSLQPSDAIWQLKSGSTMAQVIAGCLMAPTYLTWAKFHCKCPC